MPVTISQYTREFEPAVKAFNQRLATGGVSYRFPENEVSPVEGAPVTRRGFVAVQDNHSVRGGYLLKDQRFWLNGRDARVGFIHLPLSEGLIDRTYSTLGVQLLAHAHKHNPWLFGLGIGSHQESFARVVSALGWKLEKVPFFFKVMHPFRIAKGLRYLRHSWPTRLACDAAAWTGTAWLSAAVVQCRGVLGPVRKYRIEQVASLDDVADDMWDRYGTAYRFLAWRDRGALHLTYPMAQGAYLRFQVFNGRVPVGWAIALDTRMSDHKYFGNLRVGTIVDCLGDPQHAGGLIAAVSGDLAARDIDMIVTNQSASVWQAALRANGFVSGPSNFLLAVSPRLATELRPFPASLQQLHLTRGDGDGPINL